MSYKLVKDESRRRDRKSVAFWKVASAAVALLGASTAVVGVIVLVGIEDKAYETTVDQSFSSTPRIVLSLVLLAIGVLLMVVGAWLRRKGVSYQHNLKGTTELWQSAYIKTGDLPFGGAVSENNADAEAAGPPSRDVSAGGADATEGVALCPRCSKIVRIRSGTCLECGNRVV